MALAANGPMVDVRDLRVRFAPARATRRRSTGSGFQVQPGEVLGLIGESGCGKSVTLRALMRLLPEAVPLWVAGDGRRAGRAGHAARAPGRLPGWHGTR
jgi:ABC-type dipeptide/oligopeptide/nickel transport system ATPase component